MDHRITVSEATAMLRTLDADSFEVVAKVIDLLDALKQMRRDQKRDRALVMPPEAVFAIGVHAKAIDLLAKGDMSVVSEALKLGLEWFEQCDPQELKTLLERFEQEAKKRAQK